MGLYKDHGAGHFSITYGGREMPFGGLDASAPDAYIAPNRVLDATDFALVNNAYCSARWTPLALSWSGFLPFTETLIGMGESADILFAASYESGSNRYYFYTWLEAGFSGPTRQLLPATPAGNPNAGGWTALTYYAINGILYFTGAGLNCIYQFTLPSSFNGYAITAPTILTTFLGCKFLGELNGRLMAFYTTALTSNDGTGSTYTINPYQVAWSAALEQYNIWAPLTPAASPPQVPTGAGFNNIPDVQDVIQGFFSQGATIYVIRTEGVSQISPLSNGVLPFDFNHLWASAKGMGTRFSSTVNQYGSVGAFFSSIDIISMGYSGINVISGPAKSSYYAEINDPLNNYIYGALTPFNVDDECDLFYLLSYRNNLAPQVINTYAINVQTQETMGFELQIAAEVFTLVDYRVVSEASILYVTNSNSPVSTLLLVTQILNSTPVVYYIPRHPTGYVDDPNSGANISFPPEEISFLQDITIDGVGLYLQGTVGQVLSVSVSGVQFQDVTLTVGGWSYYRSMPNPTTTKVITLTQKAPQLTLVYESGYDMQIGKAVMYGSYTEARPF